MDNKDNQYPTLSYVIYFISTIGLVISVFVTFIFGMAGQSSIAADWLGASLVFGFISMYFNFLDSDKNG